MNLLIDIGNSYIKYAEAEDGNIGEMHRINHSDGTNLIDHYHQKADKIVLISVLSNSPIVSAIKDGANNLIEVSHGSKFGFKSEYQSNTKIGIDRLVNISGALEIFPNQNTLVIDIGSAITYDLVTFDARFLGGNISPGMKLRFKSLNEHTSDLPFIESPNYNNQLGKNTETAISNGVIQGIVYEIEAYIERLQKGYTNLQIIMTGGDARYFADQLKSTIFVEPKLTIIGLNRILRLNVHA